ncbi:MAG: tRNA uridine-5-carboxymethylaminomethyl(34) synthesis GTPase MnmE [Bdellovibrionales bacterium]|nr:tRNA uridine-5-carboxymethylaminomethyl(34) synthesis GTPase MnmE [Bdellovibrionales bacterium]
MAPDTIAAPITAPGTAAVGAVRVSGPLARHCIETLVQNHGAVASQPRRLVFSTIFDFAPGGGARCPLDQGMVAFFPGPQSFTGEDCVEFHLHGSPYLVRRLLESLAQLGVRSARAGEFTERAFLNGRMDLSQAEAVADLIAAETEAQARVALDALDGRLSNAVTALGVPLKALVAEIEAYIDFPEEDIEPLSRSAWRQAIDEVRSSVKAYVDSFATGRLCREGAQVVLAGLPNVGKSSLLNALVGEERAIVTPIAGTTRDSIEERISIGGLSVRLWDTAGLAEQQCGGRELDEVEQLGIERSRARIAQADLVLFVFAPDVDLELQLEAHHSFSAQWQKAVLLVNKQDLDPDGELRQRLRSALGAELLTVCAKQPGSLETLREAIAQRLLASPVAPGALLIANRRHHEALAQADAALGRALEGLAHDLPPEFVTLELRSALTSLTEIIGVTTTDDLLGMIFSKFCIGK